MDQQLIVAILVVTLALFFNLSNGLNDSANQVATVISCGALSPAVAVGLAALADFAGSYFLGTNVAKTIGKGIVDPELMRASRIGVFVIYSAILGALSWNLAAWYMGLPSSSSHALIGGLLGAFISGWGFHTVQWMNVFYIVLAMLLSPIFGFLITYLFTKITFFFSQYFGPKVNEAFKKVQVLSLIGQSLAHGTNDGQKSMGIIVFALLVLNFHKPSVPEGFVPHWVVLACSLALSFGILLGGPRLVRKLGVGLFRVRPIHAFASQSASAGVMYAASLLGFPVSTTQVISSSILGAGAAFRPKAVRWAVAGDMSVAWLITIPASAIIASTAFYAGRFVFGLWL